MYGLEERLEFGVAVEVGSSSSELLSESSIIYKKQSSFYELDNIVISTNLTGSPL